MKRTYEELRGMTHEDLVRLVLEYQEETIPKEASFWRDKYHEAQNALDDTRDALNNILKRI